MSIMAWVNRYSTQYTSIVIAVLPVGTQRQAFPCMKTEKSSATSSASTALPVPS